MGANLVGRAIAFAVDIPLQPNEFRLLVGMSLTALDTDSTPRYFDSREASALILGRRVPNAVHADDPASDAVAREREAAFQAVKVALSGLNKLGAIKRARTGGNGRRAEYNIVLDGASSMTTDEYRRRSSGVGRTYPSGVGRASRLGYAEPTAAVGPAYPSGEEEKQEPQEELHQRNETTSPAPVDNQTMKSAA